MRSTVDAILHLLKHTIEKIYQYNKDMEIIFNDFQRAFNWIKRNELIKALFNIKINNPISRNNNDNNKITVRTIVGKTIL